MILQPSQLNKAYYDICNSVEKNLYTILFGGRNSAKSHSTMQYLVKRMWNDPTLNAIFYRKTGSDLRTKAYEPIVNVAKSMGLQHGEQIQCVFHHLRKEIVFPHGNKILFDFVDDSGKSQGLANIQLVIIDEIDQISQSEFIIITSSFRADPRLRYIFLFNPVSEKHWLKKTFFDNPDNDPLHYSNYSGIFHYTIEDNKFATPNDYITLDSIKSIDINLWRVNRLGEWGSVSVDNPFYDGFNYNDHVIEDKIPFFTNYPIYLSFDFGKADNCVVFQTFDDVDIQSDMALSSYFEHHDRNAITWIAEYQVGKAQSNVDVIVNNIVERFGTDADYYVLGDTAGGSDVQALYAEIRNAFDDRECHYVTFMRRYKPSHKASRRVNNWCMRYYGTNFKVSSVDCPMLIIDLQRVKVDDYGNVNKADAINNDISHMGDCMRYGIYLTQTKTFIQKNPSLASSVLSAGNARRYENESDYELLEQ